MNLLIVLTLFGTIANGSKILNEREVDSAEQLVRYDGRFSVIEPFPGFDVVDANESMMKYNISISDSDNAGNGCDLICKLKAACLPVIVPTRTVDETRIASFDKYWLKMKLLKDLSDMPVESFVQNQASFDATMNMIEYHLFYRIDEYNRFIHDVMEAYHSIEDFHDHEISERSWNLILKPVHLILNKLVRLNSKQFPVEAAFIAKTIKLISSPVEEEFQMVTSLITFVLFNSDSLTLSVVISSINDSVNKIISGELPFISIDPMLRFFSELMYFCSKNPSTQVTTKVLEIVRIRILPLHDHSNFFWIQESYTHAILQYFIFFAVKEGMSIKRTPFEPIFPDSSPFEDSEEVSTVRSALIRKTSEANGNRLNQLAKFDSMFKLMVYQFYPRKMLFDIYEALKTEFVDHLSFEFAFLFYALVSKPEIFRKNDEISSYIKDSLLSLTEFIGRCKHHGHELGKICSGLVDQLEIVEQLNSPIMIKNESIKTLLIS